MLSQAQCVVALRLGANRRPRPWQMVAARYAAELPLILKCNNSDSLYAGPDP